MTRSASAWVHQLTIPATESMRTQALIIIDNRDTLAIVKARLVLTLVHSGPTINARIAGLALTRQHSLSKETRHFFRAYAIILAYIIRLTGLLCLAVATSVRPLAFTFI